MFPSLRQVFPTKRNAEADRTTTYTSNVTSAPTHTLTGRDPDETEFSPTDALAVAENCSIYYRIYAEDGAIPSKTPASPSDPFLGRIKALSVPPPHTAKAVKRCIAKLENIKDRTNTSLFLTPYSQSPMDDADKVTIFNRADLGSTPQEPLALVAKMSDTERSALESGGRGELVDAAESNTTTPKIQYLYYRIYAEDGAIPSKTPAAPGDPFLGRIKAISVPPPHPPTAKAVKRCITKMENIKDLINTNLFLTPYSQSPMGDTDKVTIRNHIGPESALQEPLALVTKMSDSERSALESGGRGELASAAESDTTALEIRYLYYLLYVDDCKMLSKVAFDSDKPSLGRIRADSIAPPHSPASIMRCVLRVERIPFGHADLFANILCDNPLKEGHISILRTDGPGLSPNEPMAIVVQVPVESPIPDGKYLIKNRAAGSYWSAEHDPIQTVHFWPTTKLVPAMTYNFLQWDITHDTNGNIFMTSPYAPSSWVGAEITGSAVPVPWRVIPADSKSYYLTTDINRDSQNPRVPAAPPQTSFIVRGSMATLKEGDQWQMWEFIRI